MIPTFDGDGYPTRSTLRTIERWPIKSGADCRSLLAWVRPVWRYGESGGWRQSGAWYRLATGGWSGNEEIESALRRNGVFWALCWWSSHRGGLTRFRVPK